MLNRGDFNVRLTAFGKTMCKSEWLEVSGLSWSTLNGRLERGWTAEQALGTPNKKGVYYKPSTESNRDVTMPTTLNSLQISALQHAGISEGFYVDIGKVLMLLDAHGLCVEWDKFVALLVQSGPDDVLKHAIDFLGVLSASPGPLPNVAGAGYTPSPSSGGVTV